jgi:hypothetical protein
MPRGQRGVVAAIEIEMGGASIALAPPTIAEPRIKRRVRFITY